MQNWNSEIIFGLDLAEIIFYGAAVVSAIAVLIYYMRSGKPVRNALLGMLSGTLALAAVHFYGGNIGLALPLNGLTAFVALVFGAPGVAAMCVIGLLTG
ncbi:MAG: pro-sigmaK processing inhibitor BofA family protein [Oscillospiraceae bacterium]|nr:pro-sigmaK processing inhibitor BofA family protein [Oscillospiraceae bacterium]